jgi:hypothetical protein
MRFEVFLVMEGNNVFLGDQSCEYGMNFYSTDYLYFEEYPLLGYDAV